MYASRGQDPPRLAELMGIQYTKFDPEFVPREEDKQLPDVIPADQPDS
jgi:hypothetical protein